MSETIIITGASNGIGYHTALKLAAENKRVIAVARKGELLHKLVTSVKENNSKSFIIPLVFDIANGNYEVLSNLLEREGIDCVDALVNNAGMLINKPIGQLKTDDFRNIYEVNVFAPFMLIKQLLPLLKKSPKAHIVNISSMGGVQGSQKFAGLSAYSSSKGALAILTECMAVELSEMNIKINCLALGSANTEMLASAFPGYRAPLSAAEMAEWIAWFTMNGQNYFNGKIIPVALSSP